MSEVNRKVTYRIYPSKKQSARLFEMLRLHQRLYNVALEQRIHAYRDRDIFLSYNDQAKDLTALRNEDPQYASMNAQSEQVTLKRLDNAYKNFFRRVSKGDKPGFPRFKSFERFKGWGYASHGDGWKFKPDQDGINGTLKLSSVGHLQARGRGRKDDFSQDRILGVPKTMEIIFKNGK